VFTAETLLPHKGRGYSTAQVQSSWECAGSVFLTTKSTGSRAATKDKASHEEHEGDTKHTKKAYNINNLSTKSCSKNKKMANSSTKNMKKVMKSCSTSILHGIAQDTKATKKAFLVSFYYLLQAHFLLDFHTANSRCACF
jgi:hypothetical protein